MQTLHTFPVHPIARFSGPSAAVSRPKEFACFSYDDQHGYFPDDRSLRFYYPPRLGTDLCNGFDTFKQFDDSKDEHLDSLLETIIQHEKSQNVLLETDIVTWRGMMTKARDSLGTFRGVLTEVQIMANPYDDDGFEMHATHFEGTTFIEENHAYKVQSRALQSTQRRPPAAGLPGQDMMSYWGYKFETLSTLPAPWDATSREYIEGRDKETVDNHAQYCSVVKTGIGNTKLVLGGEVDAVWDAKPSHKDDSINWVELKTTATIESDRDVWKYERKLMKFWLQSFLLGVPKIIVGMRSKHGVLQQIEELDTQKIPGVVKRQGKGTWDGNVCMNFTAAFLEWLRTIIVDDGVWVIRRRRKRPDIEVVKLVDVGTGEILSRSFTDWRNANRVSTKT